MKAVTSRDTTLVVVSDLHVGSRFGVMPERFETVLGQVVEPNAAQRALLQCWTALATEWREPDILVVNGDVIDGGARKDAGSVVWSTDLMDQVNAAVELLRMFKARSVYLTEGSGYHVKAEGVPLEHYVGAALDAVPVGKRGSLTAWPELFLKVRGTTFNFAHHVGIGTGWYKTTPVSREMLLSKLNAAHKHACDVIVRSHVHYFCGCEFTTQRGYITPAWQLQTPYMLKKSSFGLLPDIGALRFHVGDPGATLEKRFYRDETIKPRLVTHAAP